MAITTTTTFPTMRTVLHAKEFEVENHQWPVQLPSDFMTSEEKYGLPSIPISSGKLGRSCTTKFSGKLYCRRRVLSISLTSMNILRSGQRVTLLPFKCELLVKGTVISSSDHELIREKDIGNIPIPFRDIVEEIPHSYKFMHDLDFSKDYKDSVDTVLITFIFKIEKSAPKVELKMDNVIIPKSSYEEESLICQQKPISNCKVKQLYLSTYLSDVIIACQDEMIPAHRFVLAMRSPVFKKMFENELKEQKEGRVTITNINKDVLKMMLKWMYGGEIALPKDDLRIQMDIYRAAHQYCIDSLRQHCVTKMMTEINLTNVFQLYVFGDLYKEANLMNMAKGMIKRDKKKVFKDAEMLKRYPNLVYKLLVN